MRRAEEYSTAPPRRSDTLGFKGALQRKTDLGRFIAQRQIDIAEILMGVLELLHQAMQRRSTPKIQRRPMVISSASSGR